MASLQTCTEQPPLARYNMHQEARDELKVLIGRDKEERKRKIRTLAKSEVARALDSLALEPSCRFYMRDFQERRQRNDVWYSEPFYTHAKGYKMCLVVFVNGIGEAQGNYLSVFVQLLDGEFDGTLRWPFQGNVKILLLDTRYNRHITHMFNTVAPVRKRASNNEKRWGKNQFAVFGPRAWNDPLYNEDNCLRFEVSSVRVLQ